MSTTNVNDSKNTVVGNEFTDSHIHVGDNITNIQTEKPTLVSVNLEAYSEMNYLSPKFTQKLVNDLLSVGSGKILTLTGFFGFDKASFIKHLAFRICEEREISLSKKTDAYECFLTSDLYSIATLIKETKNDSIFILNNLTPSDVNHDLENLRNISRKHHKFVLILITTDIPINAWKRTDASYWYNVQAEEKKDGLFNQGRCITEHIYEKPTLLGRLQRQMDIRNLATYKNDIKNIINKRLYKEIHTPEQIDVFLDLFSANPTTDEKIILSLINKTKKHDDFISQWFHVLPPEKQITALGMTLLYGIQDEQFFACMDRLLSTAWSHYQDALGGLDYADLAELLHFFHLSEGDIPVLQSRFPNQRRQTLKILRKDYRRRILAVLPVLTDLVNESVAPHSDNWELFGTKEKRDKLREVVAEVLSDVSRLSPATAEQYLLKLAANGNTGAQIVASKALAGWRQATEDEKGKDVELFELLNSWISNSRIIVVIDRLRSALSGGDTENQSSAVFIRATIALTLGYAGSYDPPNNLHPDIPKLLREMSKDQGQMVVNAMNNSLRILIRNHPKQLGEKLFTIGSTKQSIFNGHSQIQKYIDSIAYGLRDAYRDFPHEVDTQLEEWLTHCEKSRPSSINEKKFFYREKILSVVVITLTLLDFEKSKRYSLEEVATILTDLREKEHGEAMRSVLLNLLMFLYETYPDKMEKQPKNSIPNMENAERKKLAKNLAKRYLNQRSKMAGGDYRFIVMGKSINVWSDEAERPFTEVEKMLLKWYKSDNRNLQMIAIQSLFEVSKIDVQLSEELQGLINKEVTKNEKSLRKPRTYDNRVKGSGLNIFYSNKNKKLIEDIADDDSEVGDLERKTFAKKLEYLGEAKDVNSGGFVDIFKKVFK